jgi:hypothetical protein
LPSPTFFPLALRFTVAFSLDPVFTAQGRLRRSPSFGR